MKVTVNFEAFSAWGQYPITDEDVEVNVSDDFYSLTEDQQKEQLEKQSLEWLHDQVGVGICVYPLEEVED